MKFFYAFSFLLLAVVCGAQTKERELPLLERPITIVAENEKATLVLTRVGQAAGFSFSYNSSIIDANHTVNLNVQNLTVRQVLNEMFQGTLNYKAKGNYIILTKAAAPPVKNDMVTIVVSGYIEDAITGNKVPHASIYHKASFSSVASDDYGFFRIKIEKRDSLLLSFSKKDYRDTTIQITESANQYYIIAMKSMQVDTSHLKIPEIPNDSITLSLKEELARPYYSEPNVQNISDTLYSMAQVSLLPFIGTHGRLSGNVINDYSINFLGGYSLGTRQIELGFFLISIVAMCAGCRL
jgi:hypothetical protein